MFIENLQNLKDIGVEYNSFKFIKSYWNGLYLVDCKMCFTNKKENTCITLSISEIAIDKKITFWASYSDNQIQNDLQKKVIDVFNPIPTWNQCTFDNFVLPFQ